MTGFGRKGGRNLSGLLPAEGLESFYDLVFHVQSFNQSTQVFLVELVAAISRSFNIPPELIAQPMLVNIDDFLKVRKSVCSPRRPSHFGLPIFLINGDDIIKVISLADFGKLRDSNTWIFARKNNQSNVFKIVFCSAAEIRPNASDSPLRIANGVVKLPFNAGNPIMKIRF